MPLPESLALNEYSILPICKSSFHSTWVSLSHNIAERSEAKAQQCKEDIKSLVHDTSSAGQLEYLPLELDDISSIKAFAEAFKAKEPKLDVLWNNADVSLPPLGSVSKQGHELQIITNCLGPFCSLDYYPHHSKLPLSPRPGALCVSFGLVLRRWSSALPKVAC